MWASTLLLFVKVKVKVFGQRHVHTTEAQLYPGEHFLCPEGIQLKNPSNISSPDYMPVQHNMDYTSKHLTNHSWFESSVLLLCSFGLSVLYLFSIRFEEVWRSFLESQYCKIFFLMRYCTLVVTSKTSALGTQTIFIFKVLQHTYYYSTFNTWFKENI